MNKIIVYLQINNELFEIELVEYLRLKFIS